MDDVTAVDAGNISWNPDCSFALDGVDLEQLDGDDHEQGDNMKDGSSDEEEVLVEGIAEQETVVQIPVEPVQERHTRAARKRQSLPRKYR